jgi:hypothetical protein
MKPEIFVFNDGGRAEAGFKGIAGDCVCRAIAIATMTPYKVVYDRLNQISLKEKRPKKSSARTGVYKYTTKKYMTEIGWKWNPTMQIGSGCKVHLTAEELPSGRLIVSVTNHLVAVIDGCIHDLQNPSRDGKRCVYGFWTKN